MNEIVSKLSSYNIFNYLVPGAALCLLLHERKLLDLDRIDVVARFVLFYVVGMAVSRAGSLAIDPLLKRAGLAPRSRYADYVRASVTDDKVHILLETSNTYRTMTSACVIGFAVYVVTWLVPMSWLRHDIVGCASVAVMGMLFAVAYIKQNKAVTRRVRANIAAGVANDAALPIRDATG